MRSSGLFRCEYDSCDYIKSLEDGSRVFLLLYVNDMLIAYKSMKVVQELKAALSRKLEMKDLRPVKKILGIKIFRDRAKRVLHLSQGSYIKKVLERFRMKEAKPMKLPLIGHFRLSKTLLPQTEVEAQEMESAICLWCGKPYVCHGVL